MILRELSVFRLGQSPFPAFYLNQNKGGGLEADMIGLAESVGARQANVWRCDLDFPADLSFARIRSFERPGYQPKGIRRVARQPVRRLAETA